MAKTRINRKELRRLKLRAQHAQAMDVSTRVIEMAKALPHQGALNACLLQEKDPERRKKLFDFMVPHLSFRDPQFPTELHRPGIILPA